MAELEFKDAPFIVFSDFDGFQWLVDVFMLALDAHAHADHLTDNLGMGKERRQQYGNDILHKRIAFRDAFRAELESVNEKYTFQQAIDRVRKHIKLDSGFKDFFEWSKKANVPVVIVSSGMEPLIRALLENLLGHDDAERLRIVSNDVEVLDDGHFKLKYRHPESPYGHDKSRALRPYRELEGEKRPTIFFCGDGVSDMSAAGESDVLFVKVLPDSTNDLAAHCDREKIPYVAFTTFTQVRDIVRDVVEGRTSVDDVRSGKVTTEASSIGRSGRA